MTRRWMILGLVSICGMAHAVHAQGSGEELAKEVQHQLADGTRVELRDRKLDSKALGRVLGVPELARATELDLSGNPIGADGAEMLGRARSLTGLRVLRLERCKLDYVAAKALAALLDLPDLKELHLAANTLGDGGAAAMAYSPPLGRLETIDLSDNGIGDEGARRFLDSKELQWSRLDLSRNPKISETARHELRERFGDRVQFEPGPP